MQNPYKAEGADQVMVEEQKQPAAAIQANQANQAAEKKGGSHILGRLKGTFKTIWTSLGSSSNDNGPVEVHAAAIGEWEEAKEGEECDGFERLQELVSNCIA